MENKHAKNRRSSRNEAELIQAYLKQNTKAKVADGLDVAAVVTKGGIRGHGLMPEKFNRSHDDKHHIVKDFIPDSELK